MQVQKLRESFRNSHQFGIVTDIQMCDLRC